MHQIIYLSQTKERMSEAELNGILETARKNNQARGVTGMLLYAGNTFLQVLEGPRLIVEEMYDKIFMDERHARVRLLKAHDVAAREFDDWSMGFRRLEQGDMQGSAFFELSKSALPEHIPQEISEETVKFLQGFAETKIKAA